jgi:hemerythrin-like domain-containing protein
MEKKSINGNSRKEFIKSAAILSLAPVAIALPALVSGCGEKEKEVSPPEDLMQEHGLLNRILLIYDHAWNKITGKESFPIEALSESAMIIRTFVEDYHEKQEENYLFPRFLKKNEQVELVNTLLKQHKAGRDLTDQILQLSKTSRTAADDEKLTYYLYLFNTMYRPHEAREDTVLFPAFRRIVSQHEYDSLAEDFEANEKKQFGEDGFAHMVNKVSEIEKKLGIYELSQFTPVI